MATAKPRPARPQYLILVMIVMLLGGGALVLVMHGAELPGTADARAVNTLGYEFLFTRTSGAGADLGYYVQSLLKPAAESRPALWSDTVKFAGDLALVVPAEVSPTGNILVFHRDMRRIDDQRRRAASEEERLDVRAPATRASEYAMVVREAVPALEWVRSIAVPDIAVWTACYVDTSGTWIVGAGLQTGLVAARLGGIDEGPEGWTLTLETVRTIPLLETVERVDAARSGGVTHLVWLNRAKTLRSARIAEDGSLTGDADLARNVRRYACAQAEPRPEAKAGGVTPSHIKSAGNVLSPRAAAALERRVAASVTDGTEWMVVYLVNGVDGADPAAFWRRTAADAPAVGQAEVLTNDSVQPERVQSLALTGDAGEYRLFAFYALGSKESMVFDLARGAWANLSLPGGPGSNTTSLITALAMFGALLLAIVVVGLYLLKRRMMPASGMPFSMPSARGKPPSGRNGGPPADPGDKRDNDPPGPVA